MKASFILLVLCVLSACGTSAPIRPERAWIKDGSFVLSRTVPPISRTSGGILGGLMPLPSSMKNVTATATPICVIDRGNGKISLRAEEKEIFSYSGELSPTLAPGRFKIALKQSSPSWYAPDSYFLRRKLDLPPQGSRERLRKGALGDTALFLDNGFAIHTGPLFSEEVGGMRITKAAATELTKLLPVGSVVEIQ